MDRECPVCGSNKITKKTGTEIFEYKGEKIHVEDYTLYTCEDCGEAVADPESRNRGVAIIRDVQRETDGFLTSREIKAIRQSFDMTQDDFGSLLGGGEKAFARYETGRVMQSKAMDNLLRILREHPQTIDAIQSQNNNGQIKMVEKITGSGQYDYTNILEFPRPVSPYRMGHIA